MAIHRAGQSADLELVVGQQGNAQGFWRDDDGLEYHASRDVIAHELGRYVIELRPTEGSFANAPELLGAEPVLIIADVLPGETL